MFRIFVRCMSSNTMTKTPITVFGVEGRYVSALYSAGVKMKQLEETEKSLRNFHKELHKPKIVDFISTSLISRAAKAELLQKIGKEAGWPLAAINFVKVVAENGRLKMIRRIITMFLTVMVAHNNKELCEVITAEPLDEATRKALMDALKKLVKEGKGIELSEKIDPGVIGGMIVGFEDKHIDLTIARKVHIYSELLKQSL